MILSIEASLRGVALMLRERIAPELAGGFAGETVRLAEMLLALNADLVDGAAAVRVAENADIRSLFTDAAPITTDADLARRIAQAALSVDPGLKVSELDAESNRLRALLAELHAHVETGTDPEARQFGERIWRDLARFEAARSSWR